jgi:hypothetical protein
MLAKLHSAACCKRLRVRAAAGVDTVHAQISGVERLPWEVAPPPELRTLKRSVLACLSRAPDARPTASELAATWRNLLDFAAVKRTVVTAAPSYEATLTQDADETL